MGLMADKLHDYFFLKHIHTAVFQAIGHFSVGSGLAYIFVKEIDRIVVPRHSLRSRT